ncbi:MAG: FMN-binding protein [Acidobacteria bacterium]|nr:FMN-binding protein [Acidobacteriota bacterium]
MLSDRVRRIAPLSYAWLYPFLLCSAAAGSLITREEALAAVFPGVTIRAERIFLTEEQRKAAAALGGVEVPSTLVARYSALKDGRVVGRAYVDTHVVRTKKESLLICLDENGNVKRIEVTAFLEPSEYQARPAWYGQYRGKGLNDDLNLQRAIRPIAGATLTALAANQAVRRVLAIEQILNARRTSERKP